MSAARQVEVIDATSQGGDRRAIVVLSVFLVFILFSFVRTPVPAVNEPHYLTKAKHYWDPGFCRGDFFLESADAHVVFFQTIGLLTKWLTMEQTAWVARGLALLLLSIGWCSLISRLLPGRWAALWTVCLYLTLFAIGQASREIVVDQSSLRFFDLSGEWIVGGVEGKVFSYAFAFWAMGLWLGGCRRRAALCAGLAISFHPVVGIWSVAAAAFATVVVSSPSWKFGAQRGEEGRGGDGARGRRGEGTIRESFIVLIFLISASLPGLLPALKFATGADPKIENDAAYIQVAYRLAHHLDPMQIPWTAYSSYVALIVFWLVARRRVRFGVCESWFAAFVIGSILICLCGVLLGIRSGNIASMSAWAIRTRLLKFYWFRLADVMVPLAACIAAIGLIQQRFTRFTIPSGGAQNANRSMWPAGAILIGLLIASLFLPSPDRHPSNFSSEQFADWKEACRWISAETPTDAVFFTPTFNWAFKWYAGRGEFVGYKDVPQDAKGVVEWNNRLIALSNWSRRGASGSRLYSRADVDALREVCRQYQPNGIDYIIAVEGILGPFDLSPVYENNSCRVYRLTDQPRETGSSR